MFKPNDSKDTFSESAQKDNQKLNCKFYNDKTGTNAVMIVLYYYCRDRDVLLVVRGDIMHVVFLHRNVVLQQLGHSIFGGKLRPY
jgi:hypothetical protein